MILECLQFAGYEAYFVGGCVRDEMRGVTPQDYDLATNARPEDVESLFPKTIEVGKRFGVVLVLCSDQECFFTGCPIDSVCLRRAYFFRGGPFSDDLDCSRGLFKQQTQPG